MTSKKPSPTSGHNGKRSTQPPTGKRTTTPTTPRLQGDNRWQRTKRYGWDSR